VQVPPGATEGVNVELVCTIGLLSRRNRKALLAGERNVASELVGHTCEGWAPPNNVYMDPYSTPNTVTFAV